MCHMQHCLTAVTACSLYQRCKVHVNSGDEFCSVVSGTPYSIVVKKVKFILEEITKTQRGSRDIALFFP